MSVRRSVSDASDLNDTRSLAVLAVPAGSTVLCVSRNNFEIDQMLKARGCRVVSSGLEAVGTADAESFDAVLMLDVLGYVEDAAAAIARAREALKPGGRLIASFANVAHGAVRLSLVHGTFPYSDGGLLDRARVRFFDHHNAEALLLDGGFRIDERLRVTRGLDETEITTHFVISPDVVASIRSDPEATTYEFVFVASHAANMVEPAPAASLAERLQQRVRQLVAENCTLSERVPRLCAEVDAREAAARDAEARASQLQQSVGALEAELSRRMEELRVRHHELRELQADIVDREAFIAQFRTKVATDRAALEALETQLHEALAQKNAHIGKLDDTIGEKAAHVQKLDQHLAATIQSLQEAQEALAQRDAHIGKLDDTLVAFKSAIGEKDAHIQKLDQSLREAQEALAQRDAHIGKLDDTLVGFKNAIGEKDAHIQKLDQSLREAQEPLATQLRNARAEVDRYSAIAARPVDKTRENRLQTKLAATTTELAHARGKLAATTTELAHTREKLEALRTYADSRGCRLMDSIAVRLRRYPSVYHGVQSLIRSVVK
jgi:chromosome segregation ATPase